VRILFLSQIVPYPPHGGVLQRGYNLVRELCRHCEVHLLAFVHPDVLPTPEAVEESRRVLSGMCASVEYFSLWPKASPLHRAAGLTMSLLSSQPFSVIAHRSRAFANRVDAFIRSGAIDLVHADTLALAPFVPATRSWPAALTHHNIESVLMRRRSEFERRPGARQFLAREAGKLERAERRHATQFDVNIVVSAHDDATLRQVAPGVVTAVVPNGVDTEYFTPHAVATSADLIYTGGMNMFANRDAVMHFLDEIWPRVVAARPDARFVAVGQDPPPELKARAAADARIVVTGYVPDVRPYVSAAAVYVVPLRVGGGTRLKVLDAMAGGKALVSTTIGCEGIEVTPGQHLLTADTPPAFAEAVLALLGDAGRRADLGRAARQLVETRYAWPAVGRQLLDAYAQAVDIHRTTAGSGGVR